VIHTVQLFLPNEPDTREKLWPGDRVCRISRQIQVAESQCTMADSNEPDKPVILGELAVFSYAVSSGDGISSHP
jgi:hypothetical protein